MSKIDSWWFNEEFDEDVGNQIILPIYTRDLYTSGFEAIREIKIEDGEVEHSVYYSASITAGSAVSVLSNNTGAAYGATSKEAKLF